jgi:hypothetical protein
MKSHALSPLQRWTRVILLNTLLLLTACATPPAPAEWQANAVSALRGFTSAYLSGNTRLAEFEFARAKTEISSTGRADLRAKAELTRCAIRVASLEFDRCAGYQPWAPDAHATEQAYAAYLTTQWDALDASLLPEQHRIVVTHTPQSASILTSVQEPLARLVAAGALLQSNRLTPADVTWAVETASAQGWRRPLLAWLGIQRQQATQRDDQDASRRIQQRINLTLQTLPQ